MTINTTESKGSRGRLVKKADTAEPKTKARNRTVSKKAAVDEPCPDDLVILDKMISKAYRKLNKNQAIDAKLGDLLKMIEMRRKLAPSEEDQKAFWRMLEQVREEALAERDDATSETTAELDAREAADA